MTEHIRIIRKKFVTTVILTYDGKVNLYYFVFLLSHARNLDSTTSMWMIEFSISHA